MHYSDYKTILSQQNGMNIYRGCTHGCIYCDSRSKCYQINHDFEDIEIKRNAPLILDQQLRKKRNKGMISTGSMTDPYTHLEEQLQMTRECLKVIERQGFGVTVLTKSNRILRDLDLLKKINEKSKCVVQLTLTTYNEELCKLIEPNVSTTLERVQVLNTMRDEGIPTVVWLGPFLPFLNDSEDNLSGLLDYCVKAKVRGIVCFGFGVTMREGNREYFYEKIDQLFPGLKNEYIRRYGNAYIWDSPNHHQLTQILKETCEKHNILYKMDEVFAYLKKFEENEQQLSLF